MPRTTDLRWHVIRANGPRACRKPFGTTRGLRTLTEARECARRSLAFADAAAIFLTHPDTGEIDFIQEYERETP